MNYWPILIYLSHKVYKYSTFKSHKSNWNNKIAKLNKLNGGKKLSRRQREKIIDFYSTITDEKIITDWHQFYYNLNGFFSVKYVPESLFYTSIEPTLNNLDFALPLMDKNLLETLFKSFKQPTTIVKNSNGYYFSNNLLVDESKAQESCLEIEKFVIKPTLDTGGGRNVQLFEINKNDLSKNEEKIKFLFNEYRHDFIVQELVYQHKTLQKLNRSSLNTFRIITFLKGTDVIVLSTIIRMGGNGSFTDNGTTGGISCGVDMDGGLNKFGFRLNGEKVEHSSEGVLFSEIKFPYFEKVLNTVKKLHCQVPHFKLVSWDLTVDEFEDVILIEFNVKGQGINSHQLNNGPVFEPILHLLF